MRISIIYVGCLLLSSIISLSAVDVSVAQFVAYDLNGDGRLVAEELGRPQLFARLDRDGDGALSPEEVGVVLPAAHAAVERSPSETSVRLGPRVMPLAEVPSIGRRIDFADDDFDLAAWCARHPLTVIAARDPACPVTARYAPVLAELEAAHPEVAWLYLDVVGDEEPSARLAAERAALGSQGRWLGGPLATGLASVLQLRSTTEVLVLDRSATLRYRGAIDDRFGVGYSRERAHAQYLVDALAALRGGREPFIRATTAPGCPVEIAEAPPVDVATGPTWHGEIARIVDRHCVDCHRAGAPGPFPLTDYHDIAGRRAETVAWVVEDERMPPWYADSAHGTWVNDRRLAAEDRERLLAWIEAGCPEGDPALAAEAIHRPETWAMGEPDLVLELPEIQRVPATGTVPYRYARITVPTTEDRWIEAVEIRPTAPQVVHHVLVFLVDEATGRPVRNGIDGYFAGMVPGNNLQVFPPGTAKRLPAGATLMVQLHYTTTGAAAEDQTRIGLRFASEAPRHELETRAAANTRLRIPPGAADHRVVAVHEFDTETHLVGFMPHLHVRGTAFRYDLILPDGRVRCLLDIPAYDFNWQLGYEASEAIVAPAGSLLRAVAWYDNSAANPANPDPLALVTWGDQTWDEMMIGYFDCYQP